MKPNLLLIAALLASSTVAAPALARDDVSAQYDRWEHRLRSRVNALHVYPRAAEKGATGDVLVRFRVGGDGKPADVTIVRTSGHAIFDAAAVRLVTRIGKLGPVPSATAPLETITIKLSYGEGSTLAEDKRLARADAEERMTNDRRNRTIVARAERLAEKP
jgi:TonB family protein